MTEPCVAGTVAGNTYGVAKQARIVAVRVMINCPPERSSIAPVIAGLDWIDSAARQPSVINMSNGGDASITMDEAVRTLIAHGHTGVVSAGNDDADACTKSPARVAEAITVGATDQVGPTDLIDRRASFSNWGSCLDLFAPGVNIHSAWNRTDSDHEWLSGTSMAAPHVAGVAAQYLQDHRSATPQEVRDAILSQATRDVVTDAKGSPNRLLFAVRRPLLPVTPNVALNTMFNGYGDNAGCADWSGADGTHSIRLPSGNVAWFSPTATSDRQHCVQVDSGPASSATRWSSKEGQAFAP